MPSSRGSAPVAKPTWPEWVLREIYKVETAPLKEPKIGKVKDLFRAVALFVEWFETNHRRAQMRKRLPEPRQALAESLTAPSPAPALAGGWHVPGAAAAAVALSPAP